MLRLKLRKFLLLAATVLLTQIATAQTTNKPLAAERPAELSRKMLIIDGANLVTKATRAGITNYFYKEDRLVKTVHPNGNVTSYQYQGEKLNSIKFTDGTVHKAVYESDVLVAIESSSGKKLRFVPGVLVVKKVGGEANKESRPISALSNTSHTDYASSARTTSSLNATLIANEGWETLGATSCPLEQAEADVVVICGSGGGATDPSIPAGPDLPTDPGPADDGGGISQTPPGSAPNESPARALCMSSAYKAWEKMDSEHCSVAPTARDRVVCNEVNMRYYLEALEECKKIP